MHRFVVLLLTVLVLGAGSAAAGDGDAILGLWATDPEGGGGEAHVEITKQDGRYSGRIVWLAEPNYGPDDPDGPAGQPKVDTNNPDSDRRNDPIIGLVIVKGFIHDGDDLWHKGSIYDPDNGKTYKCKMRYADDENTLKVRGFIGFSMLGRTTIWTRVEGGE